MYGLPGQSAGSRLLILSAAFVIVVAGIKAASPIMVPFLLSVFIAIISAPAMFFLKNKGLPSGLALVLVIVIVLFVLFLVGVLIGNSVDDFTKSLPQYQARLQIQLHSVVALLSRVGIELSASMLEEYFDPSVIMRLVANALSGLGGVFTNGFLILLTVSFMLLEASSFPAKLHKALDDPDSSLGSFDHFLETVKRYMVIKTWVSLGTGLIVWLALALIGIDYPLLWGVLAFLLNYVPNIGSIIAAVPAVLLAIVQLGWGYALLTAGVYVAVNVIVGNFIEPKFMGRGLGLSTLVVFLSLIFWGWVLGPVGMLLSIPLTMTLKIALDSNHDTRWIAILLDSEEPHLKETKQG
ncbi:MAG: AI-2E family transporter [Gammaproteobacteria bacterium]|nr:MAG: AI-2E family transporter [Gammaproteobacteria bacterium]